MQRTETLTLLRLAWPAALTQLGMMMLGVVDTVMVSHYSVHALAAASVGNQWAATWMMFGMGVVIGIDPIVSQAHGARDAPAMGLALQRGVVLSLLVSVPVMLAMLSTETVLLASGQDPTVARDAQRFVAIQVPSVPFFLLTTALRHYLQGRSILRPALLVMVIGNVFNAFANWVLVFGHLGSAPLGLDGSGLATAVSRVIICVLLGGAIVYGKLYDGAWVPWSRAALNARALGHVFAVGLPIGVHFLIEIGGFTVATLIAGRLGEIALGAHTIVLNMASLTFMLPLGISIAAATRVGNLVGAKDLVSMRQSIRVAFALGIGVMGLCGLSFIALRTVLPQLYSDNPELLALAAAVLPIAAAFQISDGTQVVSSGVLRGMGRTFAPAITNLVAYYALGLPLGYYFTFKLGYGLPGLWWGLAIALTIVALILSAWTVRASKNPIRV